MVSFFGLKFGGDRKRSQKTQDKQQQQQHRTWDRIDQNTLGKGQYFGHNFSRPSLALPSLRPGTACPATTSPGARSWHAVFGNPAAASSMTHLKPPVMGNLAHNASEVNLRSHGAARDSNASLAIPTGTVASSRAPDAGKSEWLNLLDVHFGPDASSARPGTVPATKSGLPCPLLPSGKPDLKIEVLGDEPPPGAAMPKPDDGGPSGYPSPPQSDGFSERSYFPYHPSIGRISPDSRSSSRRCNAPSALRNVDSAIGACPPSPAPSPPCIRDSHDRLSLGPQRRQTLRLDFDDPPTIKKKQYVEGFIGNFADFDFGDGVSRPGKSSDKTRGDTSGDASGAKSKVDKWLRQPESPQKRLPSHASAPSLLTLKTTTVLSCFPPPPSTICEESEFGDDSPMSSVQSQSTLEPGSAPISPQSLPSRIDAKHRSMRAPPPQPLRPMPPLLSTGQAAKSSPRSPYGPSAEGESNYVRGTGLSPPYRPLDLPPLSPFSRRPIEADFPKSEADFPKSEADFPKSKGGSPKSKGGSPKSKGGLPRGRLLEPPVMPLSGSSESEDESDGDKGHETDEDEDTGPILPAWLSFENASHRDSAVPPPLSTANLSPARSIASSTLSTMAPRLPSPTFPSLTTSISGSSLELARSFELALAESLDDGLGSPLDLVPSSNSGLGFSGGRPTRMAKKAPPRPEAPVTLPSSFSDCLVGNPLRLPREGTVGAGFI
ncbi:hypothetical protein OCS_00328 [Ophiocordyceps sinensis CO18]|uniref:Uncharacterized protein n=1 Tax=Ophiocordyceps sinensis (strain Co18 / CGMCC 3.14243) TaxID=911162 RepID=T5AN02_OPHSC|nr:hypothetical protein OCS_00328 [Ophiocordyceps sinensis CO18]